MTNSAPSNGISAKVIFGVIWMVILKVTTRGLALISLTLLARLLTPDDFGIVAMAMFIYAVLDSIAWFGFDTVLIQNRQTKDAHYNTAFTFNVIFYSAVSLLLIASAAPAAHYYNEPRVEAILYWLALGAFIFGFENIGVVNFRKNLDYRKDFYFMFLKKLIPFIVTIPLAFWWRNYWALVAGILAGRLGGTLMSFVVSNYRPRFTLSKASEIFGFSKWLMINSVVFSLRTRIAEPVLGRISGARELGFFNMAYEISNLPTTELVAPINRAVFPAYAKISHDLARIRQGYLSVIGIISLLALPAAAGVAAISPLLVPLWLGDQWEQSIPLMKLLALSGALTALITNTGSVFLALGKPQLLAKLAIFYLVVLLICIVPLAQKYGPAGAAYAYIVASVIANPLQYTILFRQIKLEWREFLLKVWRPIVAAIIMYCSVNQFVNTEFNQIFSNPWTKLFVAMIFGAAIYIILIGLLWWLCGKPKGAEGDLIDRVGPLIKQRIER